VNPPTSLKKEWVLTKEALDRFLGLLDADPEKAGVKYEGLRLKLVKYFEWRGAISPDVEADETINRVARRVEEGQNVYNLGGYIFGVAKLVNAESVKMRNRNQPLEDADSAIVCSFEVDVEINERRACLDRCLQYLPEESRSIIIEYYQDEKGKKIECRKRLAARLGLTSNALRITAHRIRINLEACVRECLGQCA
jgi:DNA-directed RNA polymerase specialized sigma24 family protein